MENEPYETVNVWMRQNNLNPRQLIPALLRYDHKKSSEKSAQVGTALFVIICLFRQAYPSFCANSSYSESSHSIPVACCHHLKQHRSCNS